MSGDLDVVIVVWNADAYLKDCLSSLREAAAADGVSLGSIVVVDNASTDGGTSALEGDGELTLLINVVNEGFGFACNQGAAICRSELLLFLNPDMRLRPGNLRGPISFLTKDVSARYAVCGIQLADETGAIARSCARFPDARRFWSALLGLTTLFPRRFPAGAMTDWDHASSRPVDHVIGAFYLVRRTAFEAVEGFDERFFVYLEDLDLSHRLANAGGGCYYLADTQAFHAGGGSSRSNLPARVAMSLMARCQYVLKHLTIPAALSVIAGTIVVEPLLRAIQSGLRGGLQGITDVTRVYRLFFGWALAKFRSGKNARRLPVSEPTRRKDR